MGYLRVFVYVELGGGYFLVTREFLDTGTPRVKPVQERYIAVLCHQQESYGDNTHRCQTANQYQQFFSGDTSYEHHQKDYSEQQCGCGQVLRSNEQADNPGYYHNPFERLRIGAVLILPFGQDESRDDDNRHFCNLRGLELYTHECHPARRAIDTFHHHDQHQQYRGSR